MFIVIFEDGEVKAANKLEQADFDAADDGLLEVIRIDDQGTVPKYFINGEWEELELIS